LISARLQHAQVRLYKVSSRHPQMLKAPGGRQGWWHVGEDIDSSRRINALPIERLAGPLLHERVGDPRGLEIRDSTRNGFASIAKALLFVAVDGDLRLTPKPPIGNLGATIGGAGQDIVRLVDDCAR
jgi:hypothetical protein